LFLRLKVVGTFDELDVGVYVGWFTGVELYPVVCLVSRGVSDVVSPFVCHSVALFVCLWLGASPHVSWLEVDIYLLPM
jgi:hypothetical protein